MKKIFVAVIVLILAVGAYFLFQPRKKVETRPPVVPPEIQSAAVRLPTDNFDQLTEEEKVMMKNFESGLKLTKVYAGDMNVLPPCPEYTHEEEGFCRKGASPHDTDIPFIGGKVLEIDVGCRPDQCDIQCKKACEDAAGEECTLNEDISKECLKNFLPEKQAQDNAELREQGSQCRERYGTYFQHYRCRYTTSEYEQFRYVRTASDEECRQMYESYLKCREALPERKVIFGKLYSSDEEGMRCTKIMNHDFATARCELAWSEADRRPYGRSRADKVICSFACY